MTLSAMEDGRVGEVWIRCDRSFKEYWGNAEATLKSFPEGRDASGGWFRSGAVASEADLIDFMRARMAHFKCPKTVDFMVALPRTESGKLLKRALRLPYWTGQQRAIG